MVVQNIAVQYAWIMVLMINGYDSWGDGWNGNVFTLADSDGNIIVDFTFDEGTESSTIFVVPFGEVVFQIYF